MVGGRALSNGALGHGIVSRRSLIRAGAAAMGLTFVSGATGCGNLGAAASAGEFPSRDIEIMIPADPGGGYDQTGRSLQRALTDGGVTEQNVEAYNVSGASGAIGLTEFINDNREDPHQLMVMGLILVGAVKQTDSPFEVVDTIPIATLASEYDVIVVPRDSEYQDLEQLVEEFRSNPEGVSWGGGSVGGVDQILVGQLAQEVDVSPEQVNYIPYAGGGEASTALYSGDLTAGVSGLGEFADQISSGELRALAVSSTEPIEGVDAPTIIEAGYDVEIANWRGIVSPPEISGEERQEITRMVRQARQTSQWQETLEANDWEDFYREGEEFGDFLRSESQRVENVLRELEVLE